MDIYKNCKIYGPYKRNGDGLNIIIRFFCGVRKTKSYPRYIVEQKIGRCLTDNEEVHHINNDITDNNINNLKITKVKRRKRVKHSGGYYICLYCKQEFYMNPRQEKHRYKNKNYSNGPFCSKTCVGKYANIQKSAKKEIS